MAKNSQSTKIERNARVFHVCQRLVPGLRLFSRPRIFETYLGKMETALENNNCGSLLFLVMPNHPHMIVVCTGYDNLSKAMKSGNSAFARAAIHEKDEEGKLLITGKRVFRERPTYVPIYGFSQLLDECWYVVHNADEIQIEKGKSGDYWAGSMWRFSHKITGFNDNHPLMRLLKTDVREFTGLISLKKKEFQKAKKEFLKRFTREYEERCFKLNPALPYTDFTAVQEENTDPFEFLDQ